MNSAYIVVIIFIIVFIICTQTKEHLDDTEAIKSVASMYNNNLVRTNELLIGNNTRFIEGKDQWTGVMNGEGKEFGNGIAASAFSADKDITAKGNLNISGKLNISSPTGPIKHTDKGLEIGSPQHQVKIKHKPYVIKAGFDGGDHFNWSTSKISEQEAINICKSDPRCDRIGTNGDRYWFKWVNNNGNEYLVWGKDWPDNYVPMGASHNNFTDVSNAGSSGIKECQGRCKENEGCDFIQMRHDGHCWLRKGNNGRIKTIFVNKGFS